MKKLRIVQVGCGNISAAWFAAIKGREDAEIVGLVDINPDAAKLRANEFKLDNAVIGKELDYVLEKTKPDVVFDCTVPEAHVEVTTMALRHGCHVLGEKPMADTMANARAMAAAARTAGKIYAVMQNRRYLPTMVALRQFLDSGVIGRITTLHCDYFLAPHFDGFRNHMQHPLLLDMAIHTFDQARYLSREDAQTVLAYEWNPPGSWYDYSASAIVVFEMTNQVTYSYRGSWVAYGMNTPWESCWRFIGDKGTVIWDGGLGFQAQIVEKKPDSEYILKSMDVPYNSEALLLTGHAGCIDEFIRCILSGGIPQTAYSDNIKSLAMVHAAIAAADQGRRITCES